jgi:hypothetical protein
MRTLALIVIIILVVVFLGGYVKFGGTPLLSRLDRVMNTTMFMDLHYLFFSFLYGNHIGAGIKSKNQDIRSFQEKPLGIDNKSKYRELEKAAQ